MNNLQTAVTSLLSIALLAALPGVYFYTEGGLISNSQGSSTQQNAQASDYSDQSASSSNLADIDPVPKPSPSELPETKFELHSLSRGEQRTVKRKIMIDINSASKSQLERIRGVGPSTAERIIQYRKENGGIGSLDELDQISGFGPATIDKLRSQVKVSGRVPQGAEISIDGNEESESEQSSSYDGPMIAINSDPSSKLETLNGVGPATAGKIIDFRENKGPIESLDELTKISGIGSATVDKFRGKVTFD